MTKKVTSVKRTGAAVARNLAFRRCNTRAIDVVVGGKEADERLTAAKDKATGGLVDRLPGILFTTTTTGAA